MNKDDYKLKIRRLIKELEQKGLIKTYSEFLEDENSKIYALSEEESIYYISKHNKETKKYKIGDIVFVSQYKYKSGLNGNNHSFVIIDEGQAV